MKITKMSLKNVAFLIVLILNFDNVFARPIVEKTVDACRRNLIGQIRCDRVHQELVNYACGTTAEPDKTCEGWTLECSGAGFSACAIQSSSQSGFALLDGVDNYWGVQLHDYAVNQIETGNVLTGSHSETVVMPDSSVRIYTVVWSMTQNVNGDITGTINVTCNV